MWLQLWMDSYKGLCDCIHTPTILNSQETAERGNKPLVSLRQNQIKPHRPLTEPFNTLIRVTEDSNIKNIQREKLHEPTATVYLTMALTKVCVSSDLLPAGSLLFRPCPLWSIFRHRRAFCQPANCQSTPEIKRRRTPSWSKTRRWTRHRQRHIQPKRQGKFSFSEAPICRQTVSRLHRLGLRKQELIKHMKAQQRRWKFLLRKLLDKEC